MECSIICIICISFYNIEDNEYLPGAYLHNKYQNMSLRILPCMSAIAVQ